MEKKTKEKETFQQMKWKAKSVMLTTTVLLGTGSVYCYKVYDEYKNMQVLQIESFDSVWKDVFDDKSKMIKLVSEDQLSKLKNLAKTPSDRKRYEFADISNQMMRLINKDQSFEIEQITSVISKYHSVSKIDDDFVEQQKTNEAILAESEKFISELSSSIESLDTNEDLSELTFDTSARQVEKFKEISTSIRWSRLKEYNEGISKLNLAIENQVNENHQKDSQTRIANLKSKFDAFLALVESTKESLKKDYISSKDLKMIVSIFDKIGSDHKDWLNDQSVFEYKDSSKDSSTSFSQKFFDDNSDLAKYKDLLSKITISVKTNVSTVRTHSKSEESKSMRYSVSHSDVTSLADSDIVELSSLSNLKISITVNQQNTVFEESRSSSRDRSDSESSSSSSEERRDD